MSEKKLPSKPAKKNESPNKIPPSIAKEIAKVSSEIALKCYMDERMAYAESLRDKRLHNTKLLIKKYRWLSEYNKSAVYDTAQLCADGNDEMLALMGVDLGERHQVGSIRNSVIVTRIIMEHIDTMLDVYCRKCSSSNKPEIRRRWRVLHAMYINDTPKSAQEIADTENISVSMVYTDVDNACDELSSLFFGLDLSEFFQ